MTTQETKHAFKAFRVDSRGRMIPAAEALRKAREAMAAGKKSYGRYSPAVHYQPEEKPGPWRREVLAFIDKPEAFGFRFVGEVYPDGRRGELFNARPDKCGYYTDPYGDSFRDGSGLCWGVVYQLPARDGVSRFVAGYVMGGCDSDNPTLEVSRIFESDDARGDSWGSGATERDAAREAARYADSMARHAAERERDYQAAWQLGARYAEAAESIAEARKAALALLRERREAKAAGGDMPAICAAIRSQVSGFIREIREARRTMTKALDGNGGEYLCVYMGDESHKAAFCDGAGLAAFPA